MGTRADFYIGRGKNAQWLGSVAWDGYPGGFDKDLFEHRTVDGFINAVNAMLKKRDDATFPENGWPWPWEDSGTTDYAYAFDDDDGKVWASCWGYEWFDPTKEEPEHDRVKVAEFPNMKSKQNVRYDKGSGLLFFKQKEK